MNTSNQASTPQDGMIRLLLTLTRLDSAPPAAPPPASGESMMTEKQLCGFLKVSKRNLFCWRQDGLIPYFKIGRAVRFRMSEVEAALANMKAEPKNPNHKTP